MGVSVRTRGVVGVAFLVMASLLTSVAAPAAVAAAPVVEAGRSFAFDNPLPPGVERPVAEAGANVTVNEGSVVTLDGAGSSDPNPGLLDPSQRTTSLPGGTTLQVGIDAFGPAGLTGTTSVGAGTGTASTAIAYVVDISGSANDAGGCGGDQNNDGLVNRILDCQIAAILELHADVIASGTVSETGLVTFAASAQTRDLDPTSATRFLVDPAADADNNGVNDLEQVLRTLRASGGTNYRSAVIAVCNLLAGSVASNRIAVFLSDGASTNGGSAIAVLPCSAATTFHGFAVGANNTCTTGTAGQRIGEIAAVTGGTCTNVANVDNLPDILPDIIGSRLTRIELSIDGGAPIDVSDTATPTLPVEGPSTVSYTVPMPPLADGVYDVCITVHGTDSGGAGSVETCSVVRVGEAPLSYRWSVVDSDGPPIFLSSTSDPSPSFQVADDGRYTFELEVTNGFGLIDTDRVSVTVGNVAPEISVEPGRGVVGGVTVLNGSFTDVGYLDTHRVSVNWGDGTITEYPASVQGSGWGSFVASHVYDTAGLFDVHITVTDDDGASASTSIPGFTVSTPAAVWANSTTEDKTFEWTGASGLIEGRVHSNNELRVTGASKTIRGQSTYVKKLTATGANIRFEPPAVKVPVQPLPFRYDIADFRPGGPVAQRHGASYFDMTSACKNGRWQDNPQALTPGVYYANCNIQFTGAKIGGNVTLVAEGTIKITGAKPNFTPFHDGVLFLSGATGSGAVEITGASSRYLGLLYAERGEIKITGASNQFTCGIIGDRVRITGASTTVRAGECGTTDVAGAVAGPLLVPDLRLDIAADPTDVLPGSDIDYRVTAANDGALLIVPGVVGLQNLGSSTATVDATTYAVEYRSTTTGNWVTLGTASAARPGHTPNPPLPANSGLDLNVVANARPGVTYPDAGIAGTQINAGAFATWGAQAVVTLDAATVAMLADPTRVDGLRNRITIRTSPAAAQVQSLFEIGPDFLDEVRALSADVTGVTATVTLPTGDPVQIDLGDLAPGTVRTHLLDYTAPVPAPRGAGESDAAYVARLSAIDGGQLAAAVFGRATGGVGLLVPPLAAATVTQYLPVISNVASGPSAATSGERFDVSLTTINRGSVAASSVVFDATVDGAAATPTPAVPATLNAGDVVNSTLTVDLDPSRPTGTLATRTAVTWSDAVGNDYGPVEASVVTTVGAPAALQASLRDRLLVDADDNGLVSPGDTIGYDTVIRNAGDVDATGLVLHVPIDPNSSLVPGSVTTTAGSVVTGNDPGDDTVTVDIGTLAGGGSATVSFAATIDLPLADGVSRLTVQGAVEATSPAGVLTDDPDVFGVADPTVTRIVVPRAVLVADLAVELAIDADGSGHATGGDTLAYRTAVTNDGTSAATDVTVDVPIPSGTTVVPGSMATTGVIVSGTNPGDATVTVRYPHLAPEATETLRFRLRITDPIAPGITEVTTRATVDASDAAPVTTADATIAVFRPGDTGGGGDPGGGGDAGPVGNGLPAPTVEGLTPADGTEIASPTQLTATLTPPPGETVVGWRIVYRRPGSGRPVEIAAGPGAGVDAVIDPTTIPNGHYIVSIVAESSGGGISVTETSVLVTGDYKPGRFTSTWTDMSIQVGGQPIQVQRTYDSFDKSQGDFGVGWSLDFGAFRVASNGPLGRGGWSARTVQPGMIFSTLGYFTDRPHFVSVTWPNGFVETFDLTPANGSTFFPGLTTAQFTGRPGSTSTLAAVNSSLYFGGDGNLRGGLFGIDGIYNPTQFRLTARGGTEFLIDRDRGLLEIRQVNGDMLRLTPNGITSTAGPGIVFARDTEGRISRITDPAGGEVTYGYDTDGNLITVTDQNGNDARFSYLPGNYLDEVLGELATPQLKVTYDADGRMDTVTDGAGNVVEMSSDPGAMTESFVGPDPRLTTVNQYDTDGNLVQTRRVFGGTTLTETFEYDATGRLIRSTDENGIVTASTYSARGDLLSTTDLDGNTWVSTYDALGQPLVVERNGEVVATHRYDPDGFLEQVTYSDGTSIAYDYDVRGRPVAITDRTGRTATVGYDSAGFVTRVDDVNGVTRFTNDAAGRTLTRLDPQGSLHRYSYDAVGNVTSFTDPIEGTWGFEYDAFDRLTVERDPAGATRLLTYDGAGRLDTMTDRTGAVVSLGYTPTGQISSRYGDDGSGVTMTYDPVGRTVEAANGVSAIQYVWDDASQLIEERITSVGGANAPPMVFTRTSTPAGQPTSITDPFGTTTYTYDATKRLSGITDTVAGTFGFGYDAHDRLVSLTRPNGANDTYSYGPNGLNRRATATGAGEIDHLGYSYLPTGLPDIISDPDGVRTLTYDSVERLLTVDHPAASGVADEQYQYDGNGNRTSWVGNPSGSVAYDDAGRLTADGTYQYVYDAEGRLTRRTARSGGAVTTYEWNALHQLVRVVEAGQTVEYGYDPEGRLAVHRVNGTETYRYWDGANLRIELDADGDLIGRHVNGLGHGGVLATSDGTETVYPLLDPTATVTAVTDAAGAVTERYRYDSFGNAAAGNGAALTARWHGLSSDATGLHNAWMRQYDATTGRFLSEDPVVSSNPYAYSHNNPIAYSDPTGLAAGVEYSSLSKESAKRAPALCAKGSMAATYMGEIGTMLTFAAAQGIASGPGLYAFNEGGKTYVGRSNDVRRRIIEHVNRTKKLRPGATVWVLKLSDALVDHIDVAEQLLMRDCGSVKGSLTNRINAINSKRRKDLYELHDSLLSLLGRVG